MLFFLIRILIKLKGIWMLSKKHSVICSAIHHALIIASCFTYQINGMGGFGGGFGGGAPDIPYQYASKRSYSPPPKPLLIKYAGKGSLSDIQDLLKRDRQGNVHDLVGALQKATSSGQPEVLRFLLQQPEIQQKLPTIRWSLYHAGRKHREIARIMIDAGAPLEPALYHNCACSVPCNHLEATRLLLQHGAAITPDRFDDASRNGAYDYVKLFLEHKAEPNVFRPSYLTTIFHNAGRSCITSQHALMRLLALYGARIAPADEDTIREKIAPALSLAMLAATQGDILTMKKIIIDQDTVATGAFLKSIFKQYPIQAGLNAALRYAAANAQVNAVDFLVDNGANPFAPCPDVADYAKTSEDLVRHLLTSQTIDPVLKQQYNAIVDLFQTNKKAVYFKARSLYWHFLALKNLPIELKLVIAKKLLQTNEKHADAVVTAFEEIEKNHADLQLERFAMKLSSFKRSCCCGEND